MQKIIITAVIVLLGLVATAQNKKVAVFDPAGKVDEVIKEIVREEISTIIVNASGYTVLERSLISKVLEESKFQQSGLVNEKQVSAMGKHMGASSVFVSSITKMSNSNNYYISCKMIDVQTARIEMQKTAQTQRDMDDLIVVVQKMVREMLGVTVVADRSSQQTIKNVDKNKSVPKPAIAPRQLYNMKGAIFTANPHTAFQNKTISNKKDARRELQEFFKDNSLNKDEVRKIMQTNTEALRLYNKSLRMRTPALCFYFPGLAFNIAAFGYLDDTTTWGYCMGAALAMYTPALILVHRANKTAGKSVDVYNTGINRKTSAELKFGFTQNGVGLALKF